MLGALLGAQVSSVCAQNMLVAFERDMRQLVEAAKPSVVTIMAGTAAQKSEGGGLFGLFRGKGNNPPEVKVGSGLIVSSDGFIVTKESVVRGADQIETTLSNGQMFRAEVVALDSASGVAVLKIAGEKFSPAPIGNTESAQAGSWVTVIGNALGMPHAVSVGVMSAIHASGVIQISANVDPGSNGSPVFNTQGHAVGIVSGRMGLSPQNVMPENYFSCTALVYPLASYLPRLREIARGYYESRGWLGVTVMADTKSRSLRVLSLVKGGPAEYAGIQVGDVITHFTNQPVDASTNLPAMVAACKPGAKEALKVMRGDSLYDFNVQIGQQMPIALNELQPVRDEIGSEAENRSGKTPTTEVELRKIENFQIHQRIRALEKELKYLRSLQQK
ncbi:MAG: S1C family serine protease [candidate division KSB1 bacterium]|nr:S1C family serine protease [candidate division KSB1 bacterium]